MGGERTLANAIAGGVERISSMRFGGRQNQKDLDRSQMVHKVVVEEMDEALRWRS